MTTFVSSDAEYLGNLFCGCGKPAQKATMVAPQINVRQRKLSKTEKNELPPAKEPQPYGWGCNDHFRG